MSPRKRARRARKRRLKVPVEEIENKLNQAIGFLQQIAQDASTPKNVRQMVQDAITALKNEKADYSLRIANAVSLLDEAAQDPNIAVHTRVNIWNVMGLLESIKTR